MRGWSGACLLAAALLGQGELDCARPAQAHQHLARLMLAEIEGAEDIHRAEMWQAFGRCEGGAAGESCREEARRRFGARWDGQREQIEAKYRRMLLDFDQGCRGAISRGGAGLRVAS